MGHCGKADVVVGRTARGEVVVGIKRCESAMRDLLNPSDAESANSCFFTSCMQHAFDHPRK